MDNALIDDFYKNNLKLSGCKKNISECIELLIHQFKLGRKLLVCGNGGSASDSMHIVGELQKGFRKKRSLCQDEVDLFNGLQDEKYLVTHLDNGLPVISLVSEVSLNTAIANDCDYDLIFAQQVWVLGKQDDVLLCISTSGNSRNVVLAAQTAVAKGLKVVSLVGENKDCRLADFSDVLISVPERETYRIQEMHLPIYHLICAMLEQEFFNI